MSGRAAMFVAAKTFFVRNLEMNEISPPYLQVNQVNYELIPTYTVPLDVPKSLDVPRAARPSARRARRHPVTATALCVWLTVSFWLQTEDTFCRPARCARQRASPPRSGGLRCGLFVHKKTRSHQIFVGAGRHVCPRKNLFLSEISRSAHICK